MEMLWSKEPLAQSYLHKQEKERERDRARVKLRTFGFKTLAMTKI